MKHLEYPLAIIFLILTIVLFYNVLTEYSMFKYTPEEIILKE